VTVRALSAGKLVLSAIARVGAHWTAAPGVSSAGVVGGVVAQLHLFFLWQREIERWALSQATEQRGYQEAIALFRGNFAKSDG
jgi:hypothetical protein